MGSGKKVAQRNLEKVVEKQIKLAVRTQAKKILE